MPGRIFFADVPGAAQSLLAVLGYGPCRTAPDFLATLLAGAVLTGFAGRINMNLREAKGYAYGTRGGFHFGRDHGMFGAHASVQANATYASLLELHREIAGLATGTSPVTPEELDREKTGAILALPAWFATAQAALAQYRALVYFGLPLDSYNHFADELARVGEVDVAVAAARHLPVDDAAYVVVGDGAGRQIGDDHATLREALARLVATQQLGAGALVELDADGSPI
jgi:zinc protease